MDPEVVIPAPLAAEGGDSNETAADEEEAEPPNIQEELDRFRKEWHEELTGTRDREPGDGNLELPVEMQGEATNEEKASYWFTQGVNAEQSGQLHEAIAYYRKAVQLVPDIEFRLADFQQVEKKKRRSRQESESSVESVGLAEEEEDDEEDLDNLIGRFQRLTAEDYVICQPRLDQASCHIGHLPVELMTYILKWVVSQDLDTVALDSVSRVCRGFYLCARDEELWRLICQKIWDMNVGRPRAYGTWRNMYIERPHLRFNGCYISRMSYYRYGERGMDNFYKPFQMVEYFRYVRFFPEGHVLMFTSPEDPFSALPRLKTREARSQGLLKGYFRMAGNQVTAVLKRVNPEHTSNSGGYYRYKRQQQQQRQNQNDSTEQTFHVEFEVVKRGRRSYAQLNWTHYAIHTRDASSEEENITEFELKNDTYPPMLFSRVKSYTAFSEAPLE